jgi:hypothetical protein
MGYGHLRAAAPLAERLATDVLHADRLPLADVEEQRLWARARMLYEGASRLSSVSAGGPLRVLLDALTYIAPLHPYRDLSAPNAATRALDLFARRGLGRGLIERMRGSGEALVTTFFTPAVLADRAGLPRVSCIVTDADIHRVWAPLDAARSSIRYFAPSVRVMRRLRAYGVPEANLSFTGFPLPHQLLGGEALPALKRNLARRLGRLDPQGRFIQLAGEEVARVLGPERVVASGEPPHVTFAVGGAGAQVGLVGRFLPGFAPLLRKKRLRLTLVAGVRAEVATRLRDLVDEAGLSSLFGDGLEVLQARDHADYFRAFNALLADTDLLWTKPSELTFFAALGLPLLLAPAMGRHEVYNGRWVREAGAAVRHPDPRHAAEHILDWVEDGTLAGAAWNGFRRLPNQGLYRIIEKLSEDR